MLFATPEDKLFIYYLSGEYNSADSEILYNQVNWQKIFSSYPASYLYNLPDLPPEIKSRIKDIARECLIKNQKRLYLIRKLASMAKTHNIPLLFVKGAAEITRHAESNAYLAARSMADIDIICQNGHIEQLNELMQDNGHIFYDYGLSAVFNGNKKKLDNYLISKTGHLVYNFESPSDNIELHCNVTNDNDLINYPDHFIELLWNNAESVPLESSIINVPSPEHMAVYCICHAASPKNNIFFPEHKFSQKSPPLFSYINSVLNREQLKFLCQMRLILTNNKDTNNDAVKELLNSAHNPLLKDYIRLASYYLRCFEPERHINFSALITDRKQNIRSYLIPQCAKHIIIKTLRTIFKGKSQTSLNRVLLYSFNRFI